jgi:hypothetical protein
MSLPALQLRKETYSRLTPVQRLQVARHPNRPTCLDIILNITDKFVELHGDRAGLDDPAIVCGIGSMDGTPFMFIGHQKGRNTKVISRLAFGQAANCTCNGDACLHDSSAGHHVVQCKDTSLTRRFTYCVGETCFGFHYRGEHLLSVICEVG